MTMQELNTKTAAQAVREAENSAKMLHSWAQKQGAAILRQMELKRAAQTLSLHWPKIKQGWLGGFVSGVQAGFQLGYKTANKLTEGFLGQSSAVLTGTEREAVAKINAEMREVFNQAVGEASLCWSEAPKGVFDSERAAAIVDRLMERFGTPVPKTEQEAAEEAGQERLPL